MEFEGEYINGKKKEKKRKKIIFVSSLKKHVLKDFDEENDVKTHDENENGRFEDALYDIDYEEEDKEFEERMMLKNI